MAKHDLVIIGSGPGGYTAAIRAAQLGLDVVCVDRRESPGGTCLNEGCIPSKTLLESSRLFTETNEKLKGHGIQVSGVELDLAAMMRRKARVVTTLTRGVESLFKKHRIARHTGTARIAGPGHVVVESEEGETELRCNHILIATGARPKLPDGVEPDGERIVTATQALAFKSVPNRLVVLGADYIGIEIATLWQRLGSSVTVIDAADRILPGVDAEIAAELRKLLAKQGITFELQRAIVGARAENDGCIVEAEGGEPIACDQVVVAGHRVPNTANLGVEEAGIEREPDGALRVDEHFQTSVAGIYAVGDCIGGPMLAHKAEREGVTCVEGIANKGTRVRPTVMPFVVYTEPQVAAVGPTEEELLAAGTKLRKGVFPCRANGRARTLDQVDGQVKILVDATTDRVLGVHILGPHAEALAAEAAAAIEFGASAEDLTFVVHPHPTLSEAMKEAALASDDRALHM